MASSAPPTTTHPLALDARLVRPADDGAADGESTYLHLSVRPPAQHGARPNLHLVFVVDVSFRGCKIPYFALYSRNFVPLF